MFSLVIRIVTLVLLSFVFGMNIYYFKKEKNTDKYWFIQYVFNFLVAALCLIQLIGGAK